MPIGKDRAVGIALALLVQFYDTHGSLRKDAVKSSDGRL